MKKPSSVMQYDHFIPKIIAACYLACPFALECRCILDYTFGQTSLDLY